MATKTESSPGALVSPASLLLTSSGAKDVSHFSKPFRNEAVVRLRNSTLCLVALVLLTYLLPVPSLWTALSVVRRGGAVGVFWLVCAAEIALSGLLVLNLVQAAVAIRYPRTPLPPLPSTPAKSPFTPHNQKKRRTILSPGSSPRPQRSFSSSSYAVSPTSTPSRTMQYSMPNTPSPFSVSLGASTSSAPSTPSPTLAAYHGRHPPSLGRAFNGSTLSRLADDSDDDL